MSIQVPHRHKGKNPLNTTGNIFLFHHASVTCPERKCDSLDFHECTTYKLSLKKPIFIHTENIFVVGLSRLKKADQRDNCYPY